MSYTENRISDQIDGGLMDREQQLLDHFACLAMQGMVSSDDFFSISNENICKNAYGIAEEMMKERERRGK